MSLLSQIQEVEIVYKNRIPASQRKNIYSSQTACEIFREAMSETIDYKESFYVMFLNNGNQILGISLISTGSRTGCIVDVTMILQRAILTNSKSIILAHNHPSGQLKSSLADRELTEKIQNASALLDIKTLDHLIITSEGYLSLADNGEM